MAHPKRTAEAEILYRKLAKQKFYSVSLVFDDENNEWKNGVKSLNAHTDSEWHIIIQDDAIIGTDFKENVESAITSLGQKTLLSFYTGTVRPFPTRVKLAVKRAEEMGASFLKCDRLLWGVCFAIPTEQIESMLDFVKNKRLPFDERIGYYYNRTHKPVYYTYPSLSDHDYMMGSLIGNDRDPEPRKAHKFEPEIKYGWTTRTVDI